MNRLPTDESKNQVTITLTTATKLIRLDTIDLAEWV